VAYSFICRSLWPSVSFAFTAINWTFHLYNFWFNIVYFVELELGVIELEHDVNKSSLYSVVLLLISLYCDTELQKCLTWHWYIQFVFSIQFIYYLYIFRDFRESLVCRSQVLLVHRDILLPTGSLVSLDYQVRLDHQDLLACYRLVEPIQSHQQHFRLEWVSLELHIKNRYYTPVQHSMRTECIHRHQYSTSTAWH